MSALGVANKKRWRRVGGSLHKVTAKHPLIAGNRPAHADNDDGDVDDDVSLQIS